jgi:hypothetical protein
MADNRIFKEDKRYAWYKNENENDRKVLTSNELKIKNNSSANQAQ